jgi:hypothetical protein
LPRGGQETNWYSCPIEFWQLRQSGKYFHTQLNRFEKTFKKEEGKGLAESLRVGMV